MPVGDATARCRVYSGSAPAGTAVGLHPDYLARLEMESR